MITLIYSADIAFQILAVLPTASYDDGWKHAKLLSENGSLKEMNVKHHDVMTFNNPHEMNEWIKEQVILSR